MPGLNQMSPISWSRQPILTANAAAAAGFADLLTSFQMNALLVALELGLLASARSNDDALLIDDALELVVVVVLISAAPHLSYAFVDDSDLEIELHCCSA